LFELIKIVSSHVIIYALLSLNLSVDVAHSESNSILRLIITEETGQPVVGANVLIFTGEDEEYFNLTVTNRDGFVEFRNLQEGSYRIRISFIGFETVEKSFEIDSGEVRIERIRLAGAIDVLDELEVTDTGLRTGRVGATRIRAEEFGRLPSASIEGDLMTYIQTMPGIVTTGDQGGELYIRGGTPAQNMFLLDGIPLVKPLHISNLFSSFPERAVNDVTVMAGGFDSSYMGATSAIIDVNLRTGNLYEPSASASFSPYLSTLFLETPISRDRSSLFISGRYSTIRYFSKNIGRNKQDIQFYDIIARYTLQADQFICSVSAIATGDEGRINPGRNLDLNWENRGVGVRCFGFDEMFNHPFEISAGYSEYSNSESTGRTTERFASLKQGYLRLAMQADIFSFPVDYGINVLFQGFKADFDERFSIYDDGIDRKLAVIQLYAKTIWEPGQNVAIEPGIGSQITSFYGLTFEPRIRLQYNPFGDNQTEFSFAAGIYSQVYEGINDPRDAGSTFTIYNPIRDGQPMPHAYHGILGFKRSFSSYLTSNIELYYKYHLNTPIPRWTQRAAIETETVLAKGESIGIDFRITYDRRPIYLFLGYGFSRVEYSATGDDLGSWLRGRIFSFNPGHDQRHKINSIVNYNLGSFTTSLSWEFGSGFPYTQIFATDFLLNIPYDNPNEVPGIAYAYYAQPFSERLPVYHRLDLSLKRYFDLTPGIKLGAEIGAINVYNRSNIFYLDVVSYEVVNQTGLFPYISISTTIR